MNKYLYDIQYHKPITLKFKKLSFLRIYISLILIIYETYIIIDNIKNINAI